MIGGREVLCTLVANPGKQTGEFLSPCRTGRCVAGPVAASCQRAPLGVDLVNPALNYSTDISPAASRPLPQARLAVDLGGPFSSPARQQSAGKRELRGYGRGLFEDDLPGAVAAEAEAGAAVVVGKSDAVECAGALQAVDDNGGGVVEQIDLNFRPPGVVKFVAGREDYSHDRGAVEDLAVPGDVNVLGGHELVHGGAVVFKPRRIPGFSELVELLTQRRVFHFRSSSGHFVASSPGSTVDLPGSTCRRPGALSWTWAPPKQQATNFARRL
jgi:hypothetical protein